MFSCEYCEIFKDTYFKEHLQTSASIYISNTQDGKYETKSDCSQLLSYSGVLEAVLFSQVYYKNPILKNMEKFTCKHLCRSRFLTDLKKDILMQVFSCEFLPIFYRVLVGEFFHKFTRVDSAKDKPRRCRT